MPSVETLSNIRRPVVMGVLNVTPDSFSDGGAFADPADAVRHGQLLASSGADIVDVGGESTRPGATRVDVETELDRTVDVIAQLAQQGVTCSIDTTRSQVAEAAVDAGAALINDVSGGLADPNMLSLAAERDVPIVLMHWRGHSDVMDERADYDDVVAEVIDHLGERATAARYAGIAADAIIVDPGLGFAKEAGHNWQLLRALPSLVALGYPVLVGASRKRFLGALLSDDVGEPREVGDREAAGHAISALAVAHGAWGVRVHDVRGNLDAVQVAHRWKRGN